jgi:hypothetical protein
MPCTPSNELMRSFCVVKIAVEFNKTVTYCSNALWWPTCVCDVTEYRVRVCSSTFLIGFVIFLNVTCIQFPQGRHRSFCGVFCRQFWQ